MREQHGPVFTPTVRRTTATQEEIEARFVAAQQQTRTTTRQPVQRLDQYPQASPHRVGHFPGIHPEDQPYLSQEVRQTRRPQYSDEAADYPNDPPRQKTTARIYTPVKATRRLPKTRFHPLLFVGIGLFIMIAGWLLFGTLSSWWTTQTNDWTYGRPRTYQTDDVVGHNGDSKDHPSHFVAFNLNRRVVVIEFPAEDASKAVQYLGPTLFGSGQELTPVTLSFEDRNGDGKPDLNIHVGDTIIVFVNDGTKFVPTKQQQ